MIRISFVLAALLLASSVAAQDIDGHVLSIHQGVVSLDGQALPDAAPESLDLTGIEIDFEFSGPVTPVIEIDGSPYVFENNRLVLFEESSRVGERIYGLGEPSPAPRAMPEAEMVEFGEAAYMQQVAARDQTLYRQIEQEHSMEEEADLQAERIRKMSAGPQRDTARETLRTLLSDLLKLKEANRREELARAQERLDAVRSQLDMRSAMHDEIVDARLRSLCDC